MQYRALTQQDWQPLNTSFSHHEGIRTKARRLVGELANMLNGKEVGLLSGIQVEIHPDDTILGTLKSPVGRARFRLHWALNEGQQLVAVLEIDRLVEGPTGAVWEAVWGLHIPRYDEPWAGESPKLRIPIDTVFDNSEKRSGLYEATLTVLYAIVNGPLIEAKARHNALEHG